MQNFIRFLMDVFYHLSKMSFAATIVPGRLRSELCPRGVKAYLACVAGISSLTITHISLHIKDTFSIIQTFE